MVEAQAGRGEGPVSVLAEDLAEAADRLKPPAGNAAEYPVDQRVDVLETDVGLEDAACRLFELVGRHTFGRRRERGGLLVDQLLGPLEQAPAGILKLGGLLVAEAPPLVPREARRTSSAPRRLVFFGLSGSGPVRVSSHS